MSSTIERRDRHVWKISQNGPDDTSRYAESNHFLDAKESQVKPENGELSEEDRRPSNDVLSKHALEVTRRHHAK